MAVEKEPEKEAGKAAEFVKRYWPHALIVSGTAGALVWLTARYLKEKKSRTISEKNALTLVEEEAESTRDNTVVLLETGASLGKLASKEEITEATDTIAKNVNDMNSKEILDAIRQLAIQEYERRNKAKPALDS